MRFAIQREKNPGASRKPESMRHGANFATSWFLRLRRLTTQKGAAEFSAALRPRYNLLSCLTGYDLPESARIYRDSAKAPREPSSCHDMERRAFPLVVTSCSYR